MIFYILLVQFTYYSLAEYCTKVWWRKLTHSNQAS